MISLEKHNYPTILASDEESYERHMTRMTKELEKLNPNPDILIELMRQSFPNRRNWIITEEHPVSAVCEKFPLLRSPGHVSIKSA